MWQAEAVGEARCADRGGSLGHFGGWPVGLLPGKAIAVDLAARGVTCHPTSKDLARSGVGELFLELNKNPLEDYAKCETSAEVVAAQMAYLRDDEEEGDGPAAGRAPGRPAPARGVPYGDG